MIVAYLVVVVVVVVVVVIVVSQDCLEKAFMCLFIEALNKGCKFSQKLKKRILKTSSFCWFSIEQGGRELP